MQMPLMKSLTSGPKQSMKKTAIETVRKTRAKPVRIKDLPPEAPEIPTKLVRMSLSNPELPDKAEEMIKALKKAAGYIRHELGLRVDLRYTPELLFERDRNIAYGAHIAQVLKDVIPQEDDSHGDEPREEE